MVALTLTASGNDNAATPGGPGAPVQIRIYQLAAPGSFANAEFFQVFGQDKTVLGPDLIKRDDVTLAPGQTTTLTLSPTDPAKVLAVFAAYQNFQGLTWRATTPIPPHQTTAVTVTAGATGVAIAKPPAAAAPGP